ncbi:MAG: sugar phosphate isomerase/epimerase family protein [Planctomycetaceae bacterium]
MVKSAVTISLVEQARGGPFVYWDEFEASVRSAAALGYDAVELFAPAPGFVTAERVEKILAETGLALAAVGTGAGMVIHKLSLTDSDPARRLQAGTFIEQMIDYGALFGAPAIIGSMQGRWGGDGPDRATARGWLIEALRHLGQHAATRGVTLIYEPLNRYETNHCNTMQQGVELLTEAGTSSVVLLADLFHMNIEEVSIADGLRDGGKHIGHVHFVDSNRRPAGNGHMNYAPIVEALSAFGYEGYASAEAFPWPSPQSAAEQTMRMFQTLFRPK